MSSIGAIGTSGSSAFRIFLRSAKVAPPLDRS